MTLEQLGDVGLRRVGPGGYDYGEALVLPVHLQDKEVFARPFWKDQEGLLAGSFENSGGRQDKQACDQALAALDMKERGEIIDEEVFGSPDVVEGIRSWSVPPSHTKAPQKAEGQVPGVYHFWWLAQRDLFHWAYDPHFELPTNEQLAKRYEEECGVELYVTSSTTADEMNTIYMAFDALRSDTEARIRGADDFAFRHCIYPHITGVLHWGTFRRPRTDGGDRHEPRWLKAMALAADTLPDERTLYDRILVRQAQALARLVAMTPEELTTQGYAEMRKRHDRAVAIVNRNNPDQEPIETLIDGLALPPPVVRPRSDAIPLPLDALLG
jgi:hypothetical protein